MKPEPLNLSGLEEIELPGAATEAPEESNLPDADEAKALLWENHELPPAEDVAFSLQQLCAIQGDGSEAAALQLDRIATASERIAAALESLVSHAATAAAALGN